MHFNHEFGELGPIAHNLTSNLFGGEDISTVAFNFWLLVMIMLTLVIQINAFLLLVMIKLLNGVFGVLWIMTFFVLLTHCCKIKGSNYFVNKLFSCFLLYFAG